MAVHEHFIPRKSFLESRAHERVSGTRLRQDCKVDVEEGEVDDEGNNDKANCAR